MADILLYDEGIIFDADDPDFDPREEDDVKVGEWRPGSWWGGRQRGKESGIRKEWGRDGDPHVRSIGYVYYDRCSK